MSIGTTGPFISICIPAYKQRDYVERLIKSILIQTFTDFELIITDDSPDQSIHSLAEEYSDRLPLRYISNRPALGTPANWNAAISQARGEWIKLIHDDDWFASEVSLQEYVNAIKSNPGTDFFFSAYHNVRLDGHVDSNKTAVKPGSFRLNQLRDNPVTLISKNIIGPPSVVIHRKNHAVLYDTNLKWLVDMDFYMRYLQVKTAPAKRSKGFEQAIYIDLPLVNIGLNELQVTKSSSLVRTVEIPEHFAILEKTGVKRFNNILVYDAWWRLMRNLNIRSINEIYEAGYHGPVPLAIVNLLDFQAKFARRLLEFGPASKSLMLASYGFNKISGAFDV